MSSRNCITRTPFWFFLILLLLGFCNGARTSKNVFNAKQHKKDNDVVASSSRQFLGFLPRHFPVPASGPSRKHNDIGLLSWDRSSP
ncbi:Protein IDA-LIKE 2 [Hirschfeldia incana]|nr:Protein IDA-LIKE 2 [Hirschfeldia incana]